jgi:signal transduction histidine kinase
MPDPSLPASTPARASAAPLRRVRGVPTLAILVAAVVVVAALAFQAFRAEQDQHATAERALKEYAGFAAWEFASNAKEQMWQAMTELLRPVEQLGPVQRGQALPDLSVLRESEKHVRDCKCATPLPASYYFRLDLRTGILASQGKQQPKEEERRWLTDTVMLHASRYFERSWRVATIVGEPAGVRRTVAYTVVRDSTGNCIAAYGVVSESSKFMAAISREIVAWPLLPPALTQQAGTSKLVSIRVQDDHGNIVYRSPVQYPTKFSASYDLLKFVSGFTVRASIDPVAGTKLLLGHETNRLQVLLALLGITIALMGIAFRQLRREAALARLRADFVSSVSHELRTPLAQIRMFAELLRMGWVRSEEERTRSLEIIDQEARRLGHLVDKVLRFERSEHTETPMVPERTVLASLVREVIEAFAPLAKSRQVHVDLQLDEDLVALVDRGALRQVMINLLDNAVKYGPAGQTVTIGLATRGAMARLWVEDEGPGVPELERATVFEPFRRLERDSNSAVAGSGIGLSVVKNVVEAHHGRVLVEAGKVGARFVVDLPREAAVLAPALPSSDRPLVTTR